MTGAPLAHVFEAKIKELGGDEWVYARIAEGQTWEQIAGPIGCSRSWLNSVWIKQGPDRRAKVKEARKDAAPLAFDDAGKILEELVNKDDLKPAEVQLGRARSDFQMKRAALLDPETFSDKQQGVNVTLNIGQLHLDALKAKGSMALPASSVPVLEGVTEPDEAA